MKKKKLTTKWFKDKKITVFGIGLLGGGVGVIEFLAAHGAHVIATDIKTKGDLAPSLKKLTDIKNVTYILGQHRREDFTNVDMVIKTPSCPWTNEHIKLAREKNIPVETDASLFMQLCKNPIIGITGTKGKTTVAHMISHLLKNTGYHPIQVGVGITPVLNRLDLLKKNSIVVFEMSSWRLSALKFCKISPQIAVFTNFFPDHMNYYKTMESYLHDKKRIFLYQKSKNTLVYNQDDANVVDAIQEAQGRKIPVSIDQKHLLDARLFVENGTVCMREENISHELFAFDKIAVKGAHNKLNMMMAIGAVTALGAAQKKVAKAALTFTPVRHRLEFIREVDGVAYYNDTAATNPTAAIAALASFNRPIILLAGGAEKNLPTQDFAQHIIDDAKDVVFFKGKASEKIIRVIKKLLPEDEKRDYILYDTTETIVNAARAKAVEGDVVLMSPGAASFSMYKNEFDRGDQFREVVNNLKSTK